ncbi:hypothetical protein RGU12_19490 [Fredinandcohnia sp. QZ13]|uniref:hypothetical protein n=1 Tax=Fredinandcohnia sp. QZ13 TaxID=3073144 RepID=UPI00285359C9|nr:hypothetical protein [Fredinandcohnia sp. QZ13]MDR4889681.1 hypothetical protein [Fredinandcohnia sp. QZ13]
MEVFILKKQFRGYEKGTQFYLIAESEFIGVKEFVMRTKDLTKSISLTESELRQYFSLIKIP